MNDASQRKPNVVVLGGGFAGLEAIFYLRKRLGRHVDLTLVSDTPEFHFKPNTIYIPFGKDPDRFVVDLRQAMDKRQIRLSIARATGVDPGAKRVTTTTEQLAYDYLLIATGASMREAEIPGLAEHAVTIWTPAQMLAMREGLQRLIDKAAAGSEQKLVFMVPPGNKCAGPLYELVLMTDTWLRRKGVRERVAITYATYETSYIAAFGPRLHEVVVREFDKRQITGHVGTRVRGVEAGSLRFEDGLQLGFDLLVSFPPYVASTRYEGLPMDERGFIATQSTTRQVVDHPDVYAIGDAGDFPVKQAFLAMLQADAAAEHIAQRVLGEHPNARFDPVSMCIMEQLDTATFAHVPLQETGDPAHPVAVREDRPDLYRVGTSEAWRVGKKLLGTVLPARFRAGQPFHAGATWAAMEAGLGVMSGLFAD
ncbi:MAG: FAD-dependent oxidoreductase [Nannocystaceae bacterium]|nr:FAD-dependent oxidoreductase [Nannocystaceae bacterium]